MSADCNPEQPLLEMNKLSANGYKLLVYGYKTGQSESRYGETQTNIKVVRDQSAQMDDRPRIRTWKCHSYCVLI